MSRRAPLPLDGAGWWVKGHLGAERRMRWAVEACNAEPIGHV